MADREDEEAEEQPRMPAATQASDPSRLAERRQVLAEAWQRLVGGEGAVGEPLGDTRLLDERIGETGRVGREREDRADRRDRDDPGCERRPR